MISKMIRHPLAVNTFSFYIINFSDYLLALLITPYLARVLLPAGLGELGLAQTLGIFLLLVLEFGFGLTATRNVARYRGDQKRLSKTIGRVYLAKFWLSLAAVGVTGIAIMTVPVFVHHPMYAWLACVAAVGNGITPLWYFQGKEKVGLFATVKVALRTVGLFSLFFLVKSPDQVWIVLAVHAITALATALITSIWMFKLTPMKRPKREEAFRTLWEGRHAFYLTIVPTAFSMVSLFILSSVVDMTQIGLFNGADRIQKAVISGFSPLGLALFPHLVARLAKSPLEAKHLVNKAFKFYVLIGGVILILLLGSATLIIRLFLGEPFKPAVGYLRIMSIQIPLIAMTHIIGRQWMMSINQDRSLSKIIFSAGVVLLVSTYFLTPYFGARSLPIAMVASEAISLILMVIVLVRTKQVFWR
jgi:PST family polysaccharide transporter